MKNSFWFVIIWIGITLSSVFVVFNFIEIEEHIGGILIILKIYIFLIFK